MADRKMDSTEPTKGKSVKQWDEKEDKKYDGHRYIAQPEKYFFKSIEEALKKKGLIQ